MIKCKHLKFEKKISKFENYKKQKFKIWKKKWNLKI